MWAKVAKPLVAGFRPAQKHTPPSSEQVGLRKGGREEQPEAACPELSVSFRGSRAYGAGKPGLSLLCHQLAVQLRTSDWSAPQPSCPRSGHALYFLISCILRSVSPEHLLHARYWFYMLSASSKSPFSTSQPPFGGRT